jgi:hypothetical protein
VIKMSYVGSAGYSGIGNVGARYVPSRGLEQVVGQVAYSASSVGDYGGQVHYSVENAAVSRFYSGNEVLNDVYKNSETALYAVTHANSIKQEYAFVPDDFLKPGRVTQPFVGDAADIEDDVKEAFVAVTGSAFPTDIRVSILKVEAFRKHVKDSSVVGFSVNRKENGLVSEVFVLADEKDRVMLTVGHEIGHVFSKSLKDKQNEEAKAFAFTRAWMEAIKEENIAGLGSAIVLENPAQNGLHDVAFSFVASILKSGKGAFDLYWEIVNGSVGVNDASS